jgi:hypothetical protein
MEHFQRGAEMEALNTLEVELRNTHVAESPR